MTKDAQTPVIYAAQVRDMHTAIHNLLLYDRKPAAVGALREAHKTEAWPQRHIAVNQIEINFRHPPSHHNGRPVRIVNGHFSTPKGVPDCY